MVERVVVKVRISKIGQKTVTIPKDAPFKEGELVEIIKLK